MTRISKSILVTGGFGFIGSHLVEQLLSDPFSTVHVVDDLSSSPLRLDAYLGGLRDPLRLKYHVCTVKDYFRRRDLPKFDEIYHLANVVGPVAILEYGGEIVRRTVEDTYAIVDYAVATGASLCDVSTSEVYGSCRNGGCSETDPMVVSPNTSIRLEYSVAKLAAEVMLMNVVKRTNLRAMIVRPFNVVGPRQLGWGGFVLPRFIRQAAAGEDLTVYGDGQMIRAFTYVTDVVDGIIRSLRKGRAGQAYNIGNPANKTTVLQLAEAVIRICGSSSHIAFVDPKKLWGPLFEEAGDKYPDATKASSELDWHPRFGLEETIRATIESMQILDQGTHASHCSSEPELSQTR
jgi:UDP-glucose 4-epimerase